MDIGGEGASVYAEAKGEYTKQLCQYLVPALQQYFLDMLEDAKTKEPDTKKLLVQFQTMLEDVADWNIDKVQRETTALTLATQCDYLEELLTAVFIAHTKVLSAIRLTTRQRKLQITIPKLDHFLHRTLTECARILWSNTFLFSPTAPSMERQRNMRQIEKLLYDGVHQGIRGLLPVKNILREYLRDDAGEDEDEEEGETEVVATKEGGSTTETESIEGSDAPIEKVSPPAPPTTPEHAASTVAPEAKEPLDLSGAVAPAAPAAPSSLSFSGLDTEHTSAQTPSGPEVNDALEDGEEEIQILEGGAEPMDEFEDLDKPAAPAAPVEDEPLAMEFETLA